MSHIKTLLLALTVLTAPTLFAKERPLLSCEAEYRLVTTFMSTHMMPGLNQPMQQTAEFKPEFINSKLVRQFEADYSEQLGRCAKACWYKDDETDGGDQDAGEMAAACVPNGPLHNAFLGDLAELTTIKRDHEVPLRSPANQSHAQDMMERSTNAPAAMGCPFCGS